MHCFQDLSPLADKLEELAVNVLDPMTKYLDMSDRLQTVLKQLSDMEERIGEVNGKTDERV